MTNKIILLAVTIFTFLISSIGSHLVALPEQKIIFVNQTAQGRNDGNSWVNAFNDLQSALKIVKPGQQVWVAKGIYTPTSGTDRTISFQLVQNTEIYGGFSGSETQLRQRDWKANFTILSGDIGQKSMPTDNTQNVVKGADDAVIDGFIIEQGFVVIEMLRMKGVPSGHNQRYQSRIDEGDSKPQIHLNPAMIVKNTQGAGAGLLNFKVAPIVRQCIIRNNSAMR